jgi:predicted nucleic acid-binding Zn ribbon protein
VRRPAPRPLAAVLGPVTAAASPQTLLARVQVAWREVAGPTLARAAAPVAEQQGVVTLACESAAWAQELELLSADLLTRVNERIAPGGETPVVRLRFVVGSVPNRGEKDFP